MTDYDYGPLQSYEIIWKSGHVETVQGHQIQFGSWASEASPLFGGVFGTATETRRAEPRVTIHGMFDGHWRLVLSAPEAEIHTVRLLTAGEHIGEAP